jgi:hypothetical protein
MSLAAVSRIGPVPPPRYGCAPCLVMRSRLIRGFECSRCGWRNYSKPVPITAGSFVVTWVVGDECEQCGKPLRRGRRVRAGAAP